ncbi:16S rRNA (guanine(966)-N(2))-methyltransferase RsmD [Algihabitans albus]|uniref:16S rRNA (guanine(966)-N(2))-methyltransferase RsmD n=1 Tax=Algihabitans albus TaxID=2164067 RepID=UPI000E5CE28D|nr:16S rRNA (guanine(966)-N(2))-methyltransferase RsmD [Algihabitans albus]
MRIVAGSLRGKRLVAPDGEGVRPTADRTREALFGILEGGRLTGGVSPLPAARVLDAFAGTGALGLEALSRGGARVDFLERYAPALSVLRANVAALGVAETCRVHDRDVLHPPKAEAPADLVFMDPPYNQGLARPALEALTKAGWVGSGTLVCLELLKSEPLDLPSDFTVLDERRYGKAKLCFLRMTVPPAADSSST